MCSDRKTPLISVIIPAYNAASTVADMLESVLSQQNAPEFEVILVDDGSTDATVRFAQEFASRPGSPLRIITHPENRGSAVAWQTGVDAAKGKYVTKLDSDDTLPPDALSLLAQPLSEREHVGVVRGWFNRIVRDIPHPFGPDPERLSLDDSPICVDYFSLCGKLIDRSLLIDNDIRAFPGLDCWEDLGVIARVMALRPTTVTVSIPVYNYWIAPKGLSLSNSSRDRLLHDHLAVAKAVEDWLKNRKLDADCAEFLLHLKFAAKVKFLRGRHRRVAQWKSTFPEVNRNVLRLRNVPLRYRVLFAAVAILPTRFTQAIANIIDR